jgi:hypothetical protein
MGEEMTRTPVADTPATYRAIFDETGRLAPAT